MSRKVGEGQARVTGVPMPGRMVTRKVREGHAGVTGVLCLYLKNSVILIVTYFLTLDALLWPCVPGRVQVAGAEPERDEGLKQWFLTLFNLTLL